MHLIRYNKKAVSPIIATILMVAVTVVLAGVLYVMVIGLSSGSADLAPLGSWYAPEVTNNTYVTFVFGSFSYQVKSIDVKLILEEGDNITTIDFPGSLQNKITIMSLTGDNSDILNIEYEDYNWQTSNINGGDKLHLYNLNPHTVYTVKVFHKPTNQIVTMTGYPSSIETLP